MAPTLPRARASPPVYRFFLGKLLMNRTTRSPSKVTQSLGKSRTENAISPRDLPTDRAPHRLRNLTLRQLRLFDAVASHLSYSRAAEVMNVTQPAVSMQIQQLEAEVGLQLLVKSGRKVGLSQAGEEMLRQCRRILNQVLIAEEAMTAFHPTEAGRGGLLHLGVVSSAHYFAPALMMAFAQRWPGVKFKLTVDRRDTILAMLQAHQLDVAIAGYPPSEADVEAETFAQNPHCIVRPPRTRWHKNVGWTGMRCATSPSFSGNRAQLHGNFSST